LEYWREHPDDPLALELALRADDSSAYEYIRDQFSLSSTTVSRRLEVLKLLRDFGRPDMVPLLLLLIRPDASPDMFQATLDVLSRFDQKQIADRLLQVYSDLPGDLRRSVREVLLQRPQATLRFLEKVDRDEIASQEIPVEELRPLTNHHSEEIDSLVRKHWGNIGPGTTEEKLATMRRLANDLRAAPGGVANGEILFTKLCAKCHQFNGRGEKIGPDLTTANRQDQAALLGNLVDPNAVIRREFISYVVTTKSGQVLTGLIAEQDAAALTLLTAENKRVKIARQEIDELVESDVSLMPEKLLETLTPQELRDLFSYLQK
jgi:putative heme-binding domain-containing protein